MFQNVNLEVTVKVDELLLVLKENREKHSEEYKVAMEGYTAECVKQLRKRARLIKANKLAGHHSTWLNFHLPTPVTYTSSYDQVIGMLTMAQDEEIELTADNYKAWVQDEWEWKAVAASNMSYTSFGLK